MHFELAEQQSMHQTSWAGMSMQSISIVKETYEDKRIDERGNGTR